MDNLPIIAGAICLQWWFTLAVAMVTAAVAMATILVAMVVALVPVVVAV